MSILIGIALVLGLAIFARARWGRHRLSGLPLVQERLESVELMLLEGSNQEANEALQEVDPAVARMRGPDGVALRVRHRVLMADLLLNVGRRDVARGYVEEARTHLDGIADPER